MCIAVKNHFQRNFNSLPNEKLHNIVECFNTSRQGNIDKPAIRMKSDANRETVAQRLPKMKIFLASKPIFLVLNSS